MHIVTPSGARFFVLFTDDYSGWCVVYFMKHKSKVAELFKNYVRMPRSETGQLVHSLRTDDGGESTNQSWKNWLSNKGIRLESSAPYTHEQNGLSERANRTVVEGGRCLLHAKHLPLELWGEAIACTVYTLNCVSNTVLPTTPYQMWSGTKPNISHLRIFGSVAYIHIPRAECRKLDSKNLKCFFVGYDPAGSRIKISRDVTFDEQLTHFQDPMLTSEKVNPLQILSTQLTRYLIAQRDPVRDDEEDNVTTEAITEMETEVQPESSNPQTQELDSSIAPPSPLCDPSAPSGPVRVSPFPLRNREPRRQCQSFKSTIERGDPYEPTSYNDAIQSPVTFGR